MRVRVLGPVEVSVGDAVLRLGQSRQQRLLAVLLLNADRTTSLDQIISAVWDGEPPRTARKLIQNSVSALRQQLVDAGGSADALVTGADGYAFRVGGGQLDLRLFEERLAAARRLASSGELPAAVELFRSGLALWRGPAFAGVPGREIDGRAARLEEVRLTALEECLDHELTLGRHHQVTGELTELAARHPLRERLAGQLMLALHRSGRRAEALAMFHGLRQRLAEDLGLDPGADVCRLHEAILRADSADGIGAGRPAAMIPRQRQGSVVPAQLPADVGSFTGRSGELAWLDDLAVTADDRPRPVVIAVVVGTAGVGKTALAVHWAHRVAAEFPDGQLYVNLRGFDPSGSAMTAAEALRGFLDGLGVAPQRVPGEPTAQSALYRSLLAGRRMLIVLDNARDADHVRPLLPGAPGCVVVVTSRHRLTGLVAAEGAHPLPLELLTAAEARELLTRRLGPDRVAAEPGAIGQIIDRCARLPLALNIVAAQAVTQPRFPLAMLADELRMTSSGLDAFSGEDAASDARAAFSWSYGALGADAARLFRLIGQAAGPDIAEPAAASVAGLPPLRTRVLLAELARSNLVTEHVRARYAMHDLLRAYAGEQVRATDTAAHRRSALLRLFDHYLGSACAAARLLDPYRDAITVVPSTPGVTALSFVDPASALDWFTVERSQLLGAVSAAAEAGCDAHAWQLGWAMAVFLFRRGLWHELAATNRAALAAATRLGDRLGMAHAYRGLGVAANQLGQLAEAHTHHNRALDLFGEVGHHSGQARVHLNLAFVADRRNEPADALSHAEQARDLYRLADNQVGEARAFNDIGWYLAALGDLQRALAHCEQALALHLAADDRIGGAETWDSIGYVHHLLGNHERAVDGYQRAIARFRELGDRYNEASSLTRLGDRQLAAGHVGDGRDAWRRALRILDDLGDPDADAVRRRLETQPAAQPLPRPVT